MKKAISRITIILLLLGILLSSIDLGGGQGERVIRIVDAENRSSITLGNASEAMPLGGNPFTVSVRLNGTTDRLFTFQVAVSFDTTRVRCTGAWIPKDDPDFVFYQKPMVSVSPDIDNDVGYVVIGASLFANYVDVSAGILCQINFTAIKTGTSALAILPTGSAVDTFLWDTDDHEITFSSEPYSVTTVSGPSPPVASFAFSPANPRANETITFDASKSYDPDGNVTLYVWDFGDGFGNSTIDNKALHNFTLNGPYFVNLTVYDNYAFNNSILREVQVGAIPYVNFTYAPLEIRPSEPVTFNASSSYALEGKTINYYDWDFGDGFINSTTDAILNHTFSRKGVFWVNLTVRDSEDLHNSISQEIFVGKPPTVNFTFYPEKPRVNEVVTFNASQSHAEDPSDSIALFVWDFGDYNTTPPEVNTSVIDHVYVVDADYLVNLTVYDNNGLYNSYAQEVSVQEPTKGPDYTLFIVAGTVIVVIIVAAVLVKKRRATSRKLTRKQSLKSGSKTRRASGRSATK